MKTYLYQGNLIEYAGFKKDSFYCFYLGEKMIYLTQTRVNNLKEI